MATQLTNTTRKEFYRINDVVHRFGMSRATLYNWMRDGLFPKQVQIGPRAIAWRASDLEAWAAGREVQQ